MNSERKKTAFFLSEFFTLSLTKGEGITLSKGDGRRLSNAKRR